MLYTYLVSANGCDIMKTCTKVDLYECSANRLCEYLCLCTVVNGTCGVKIIAVPQVQDIDWSICGIYV